MNIKQVIRGDNNMLFGLGEDNRIYRWVHHGGSWERFWREIAPATPAETLAPTASTAAASAPVAPATPFMPTGSTSAESMAAPTPVSPALASEDESPRVAESQFGTGGGLVG